MAELEIPWQSLSEEALQGVIEEFVTREGTDYGHEDYSFKDKVAAVQRQIEAGQVLIHFDTYLNTCTLVPRENG